MLQEIRVGGTNVEIASRLGLSINTVKYHVSNMLAKLEMSDRKELAGWAPSARPPVYRRFAWLAGGAAAVTVVAVVVLLLAVGREPNRDERHIWWFEPAVNSKLAPLQGFLVRDILTGKQEAIAPDPGASLFLLSWSPDGSRLAAIQYGGTQGSGLRLWRPPDSPVGSVPMVGPPNGLLYWAPDSRHVAMISNEIALVTADGKLAATTAGPGPIPGRPDSTGRPPSWSPDSQRLAFLENGEVVFLNIDGSSQRLSLIEAGVDQDPRYIGIIRWRDASHLEVGHLIGRTGGETFELSVTGHGVELAKTADTLPPFPTDIFPDPAADALQTRMPNMVYKGSAVSADGRGRAYLFHKPYPIPGQVRPATVFIQVAGREFTFETRSEFTFGGGMPALAGFVVVGDWP